MPIDPQRRSLLRRLAALAVLPAVAAGCRRGARGERAGGEGMPKRRPPGGEPEEQLDLADGAAVRPPVPGAEPEVRVLLSRARGPGAAANAGGPHQWIRASAAEDQHAALILQGPLAVRLERGRWSIEDGVTARHRVDAPGPLHLRTIDPREPLLAVEGRDHPGELVMVARSESGEEAFDVVNHVGLEAYLPGVVARELFQGWRLEAFMAQAVAARSFAAAEHAYFRERRHFDLTNTAHSQVYGGHETMRDAVDAVARTRGEVVAFEGFLVPGYYSSCCGGLSARAIDAVGSNPINAIAPLEGRGRDEACSGAPVYRWEIKRAIEDVEGRLAAYGRRHRRSDLAEVGRLVSIEPAALNPHGRPIRYAITGAGGSEAVLPAARLREAVNFSGDGIATAQQLLPSAYLSASIEGDTIIFDGRGFGHGVGLCQYGAQARAREGKSYLEIVEGYYPGAEVRRGYV
jgi:stage II sporulation protein D